MPTLTEPTQVHFTDLHPQLADFHSEVIAGLARAQKQISPKFFYDQRGSEIFDRICELPEYYPTRTETAILRQSATEMAQLLGPDCLLIEYGSGSSRKVRPLIDQLVSPAGYLAIDISRDHLRSSAETLATQYPDLDVFAVCADYTADFELPAEALEHAANRAIFFPGSTIGNFSPQGAVAFLKLAAGEAGPGGRMLVGVDLKKDPDILHAAYNDAEGVSAEFNKNLLTRINSELGADFDLDAFEHVAFYEPDLGRIEMHLRSPTEQQVRVGDQVVSFETGETIHTENSYKFTVDEFQALAAEAGWLAEKVWTDKGALFSVHCLRTDSRQH